MNIILTGMRGSGKTTIGQQLAKKIGRTFIDFDHEIEKIAKMTVSEMVKIHGWAHFRKLEQKICTKFSKMNNLIIASGGGTIMNKKNTQNLRRNGTIIFLEVPISILADRIKNSLNRPPLLETEKDFLEELEKVYQKRQTSYKKIADLIIKNKNVSATIKKIINFIKEPLKNG